MVELVCPKKNITEEEYVEFSKLFKKSLPDSFAKHYLRINGGFLDEKDLENGLWGLPVGGFESIKYGNLPIEKLIEDIGDIIIPDENLEFKQWCYVPFAHDQGGNIIFLSLVDTSYDKVFILALDGMNITELDYNFSGFIKKLYKRQ